MPSKLSVPQTLYYVTVYFDNSLIRTPNLFVKPTVDEAFVFANKFLVEDGLRYRKMSARKIEYTASFDITPDFYHSVSEELHTEWTGEFNQEMVSSGEQAIPNSLVVILSGKAPGVRGSAYFLDEWYFTSDTDKAVALMKQSNLPLFIPARTAHLYRPTDELHWTSWN